MELGISPVDTNIYQVSSIKEMKTYTFNPFLGGFKIIETKSLDKVSDLKDDIYKVLKDEKEIPKSNINGDTLVLGKEFKIDSAKFVKIYPKAKLNLDKLNNLSCKVLLYIIWYKLNTNIDFFVLSYSEAKRKLGISEKSYYQAIVELYNCGLISKDSEADHRFWINPYYLFMGNRLLLKNRNK